MSLTLTPTETEMHVCNPFPPQQSKKLAYFLNILGQEQPDAYHARDGLPNPSPGGWIARSSRSKV